MAMALTFPAVRYCDKLRRRVKICLNKPNGIREEVDQTDLADGGGFVLI
jgi:hypothetical protein